MTAKSGSSASMAAPSLKKPGLVFLIKDQIVVLRESSGSKGRVFTGYGHLKSVKLSELNGPFDSFSLTAGSDKELKDSIQALDDKVLQYESQISLSDLWELIHLEDVEGYSAGELVSMWLGESSAIGEMALNRLTHRDRVYFSVRNGRYYPNSEKRVEQAIKQAEAAKEKEARTEKILLWFTRNTDFSPDSIPEYVEPVIQSLRDSACNELPVSEKSIAGKVLKALKRPLEDGAFSVLAGLGIFSEDENLLLLKYNTPSEFDDVHKAEALRIQDKIESGCDLFYDRFRETVTAPVFTIDDPDTTDRDDGLSWQSLPDGTFEAGVHITDVSAFICKDSILDKEAFRRVVSVYLPDRKYPMVPELLSGGSLSLLPGKKRRCVSVFFHVDSDFNILDTRCALTWVEVDRGWTYNEVLDYLDSADRTDSDDDGEPVNRPDLQGMVSQSLSEACKTSGADSYNEVFSSLRKLADRFFSDRLANGASESKHEYEMKVVVHDGHISTWKIPKKCPARTLVAEFMIAANVVVASMLTKAEVPAVYRTQSAASEVEPDSITGFPGTERDDSPFKIMNRVIVTTVGSSHSSLGVDIYTQVTSPVRRYADLLVQRQLTAFLSGVEEEHVYTCDELEYFISTIGTVSSNVKRIEKWGVRYWLLKYLHSRRGEVFSAVVVDKRREVLIVELTDYMIRGRLYPLPGSVYERGDSLDVKISDFDPRRGFIRIKECRKN